MRDSKLKRSLIFIYERYLFCKKYIIIKLKYRVKVMTPEQTLNYIMEHNCSVARYGDGEFNLMLAPTGLRFQSYSPKLAEKLRRMLENENEKLLLCIPGAFNSVRHYKAYAKKWWSNWSVYDDHQKKIVTLLCSCGRSQYLFGDAEMTRIYMHYKSVKYTERLIPLIKKIWDKKDIIIVEGNKTCLGVGNDLLTNANSVKRILCPATDAFDCYEEIVKSVLKHYNGELVLLALGPTATVLASDFSKHDIQAIDVGHIDIEYEWYKRGSTSHEAIPGKYTNEAIDGIIVDDSSDHVYLQQIIDRIGN